MKITIENSKKLARLKEEFNEIFPFLTLEFFETLRSTKSLWVDGHVIGEYRKNPEDEVLIIFPEMSVSDLEKIFLDHFEIPVQILRKSGNVWLKTSHTDSWSLQQQNKLGEIISDQLSKHNENKKNK